MVYRGYDSEKFITALRGIKEKNVNGQWIVDLQSHKSARIFFESQTDFRELADFLRICFDYWYIETIANKAIFLDGSGKIVGNDNINNEFGELANLLGFSKTANDFMKIGLNIPVIGEVLSGFSVLSSFVGIFTNESRTKSFEAKEKLALTGAGYNYSNYQGVDRDVRRVCNTALLQLYRARPKCISATNNCFVEHLRYALRAELLIACTDFLTSMVSTYLNDANFKQFINDWKFIKAQMLAVPPKVIQQQTPPVSQDDNKGCLGSMLLIISSLSLLGYGISFLI